MFRGCVSEYFILCRSPSAEQRFFPAFGVNDEQSSIRVYTQGKVISITWSARAVRSLRTREPPRPGIATCALWTRRVPPATPLLHNCSARLASPSPLDRSCVAGRVDGSGHARLQHLGKLLGRHAYATRAVACQAVDQPLAASADDRLAPVRARDSNGWAVCAAALGAACGGGGRGGGGGGGA